MLQHRNDEPPHHCVGPKQPAAGGTPGTGRDPAAFVAEYPQEYYPDIPIRPLGPTPADAVEQLRPLVELGVTHFMIYPSSLRTLARFSAEVAPVLAGVKARTGDETFT